MKFTNVFGTRFAEEKNEQRFIAKRLFLRSPYFSFSFFSSFFLSFVARVSLRSL